MRWPLRVLLLAGSFLLVSGFLYATRWRTPATGEVVQKYFTWDNPDFAYFNNQFILHLASAVQNPLPGRKLLSPGITCPAIRGVPVSKVIAVTDVFAQSGLEALGYETDPLTLESLQNASTLVVDYTDQIVEGPEQVVRVTAPSESYWRHSAFSFVRDAFVLPLRSADWRKAASHFTLAEPLQTCVDNMLPEILPHALALHIRTWPPDLSFGQRDPCHQNEVPILRSVFGKCGWTSSYLYKNIQRVQSHPEQPVIIATDDRDSPTIRDLVRQLNGRAHFLEMTTSCSTVLGDAYPPYEHDWRLATYWPIIEATALTRAESFVGSFWSTLSQLVAIRRDTRRTFFFQTPLQAFLWDARVILGIIVLFGVAWVGYTSVHCILINRRQRMETLRQSSTLSA